jgi:putative oxidoreductase
MLIKKIFSAPSHTPAADVALLIIRLVAGVAFIWHGSAKIQSPFGWMGPGGFAPGWLQALASIAEFGGGILLIFGLLTALGALGIACNMVVAIYMHSMMLHDPFVSSTGGSSWELAATYLALMVMLKLVGPGKFSVDHFWFGPRKMVDLSAAVGGTAER